MNARKKILIIVMPVSNRGGIIRRLKLWATYLSRSHNIKIFCHALDPSVPAILENDGVVVANSTWLSKKYRLLLLPSILAIRREIKVYQPDVIISIFLWSDFFTSCTLKMLDSKEKEKMIHLLHIAGNPVPFLSKSFNQKVYKKIVGFSLRSCDRIIAICRHDANLLKRRYHLPNNKITVVPIGIELPGFSLKIKLHDPFVFGVVSRLNKVKNISALIENFYQVVNRKKNNNNNNNNMKLYIYGNGEDKNNLIEQVRQLGLENSVIFKGHTNDPYLAFDTIDCLLMFSFSEGTPRSILEAASRGVPTIANNVGGISEMICHGRTGYVVNNQTEMVHYMKQTMNNKTTTLQLGQAAFNFINNTRLISHEIKLLEQMFDPTNKK